ncbi:MAG: hypothetical protein ACREE6_18370, partial [Limisphaerales bacterium]
MRAKFPWANGLLAVFISKSCLRPGLAFSALLFAAFSVFGSASLPDASIPLESGWQLQYAS